MTETSKTILVTGGYGFMGSHFVRHLYRTYPTYRIINLDLLTYAGNPDNLADLEAEEKNGNPSSRRYQFIKGDICDALFLEEVFRKHRFDAVAHFAAETHVDRSIFNVSDFIRTNIDGTHLLIDAVQRHGVPRMVHISTDEVYGSVPEGTSGEDAPLRPSNPYSTSKACADLLAQSYMYTHKVPLVIVRGSNNYGPYQYPEKLIPLAVSNLIAGKKIPVHGDGGHVRSWLHVGDFCSAVDLAMHKAPVGTIYNASGDGRTNIEVLAMIADTLDVRMDDYRMHTPDRPGADRRYAPDSTKIRQELGWSPLHRIEESIGAVAEWYLKNREWWSKIRATKEYQDHYAKQSQGKWY